MSVGPHNWEPLRADLVIWVRGIDSATAFAGLLNLLESERRYQYQDIAGELLEKGEIPCPLSLSEFLRRVLPLWDLSAATVPKYAAREFGRDAVLKHLHQLLADEVPWASRDQIDTMRYHLGEDV